MSYKQARAWARRPARRNDQLKGSVILPIADFDLGDLLLAMLAFYFLALALWLFISLFADIFTRRDLSGWGKAGWTLVIFILPLIGIVAYLVARPAEPAGRSTAGGYQESGRPPGESAPR